MKKQTAEVKKNKIMIPKILLPIIFFMATSVSGQNFKPTDSSSKVHFIIKNFGINTGGDFSGLKGEIFFFPANLASCTFSVSVAPSTIDTDNPIRDKHLKSDEFFDVEKFPEIKMVSTKIEKTPKPGFYLFTGNLTIHGVTKTISFPFHAEKIKNDYLFNGDFEIDRVDFGVGEKSVVLSNKVIVSLSVLAKKS